MYLKVRWSIFSALERRTIARFTTEGKANLKKPVSEGFQALLISSFVSAAEALGANPKFLETVSRRTFDPPPARAIIDAKTITIKRLKNSQTSVELDSDRLLRGAVTVRVGTGQGSGFIISRLGYVLTNHHVVGDAETVRIVFPSRLEVTGWVLRSHPGRDVALIKIDIGGLKPLPIRNAPVKIAEAVYAVGTPLKEDLRSTVNKGIGSARRINEKTKLEQIQADGEISSGNTGVPLVDQQGNVVGISVSGMIVSPGQLSSGLNFFIPIGSALKMLKIKMHQVCKSNPSGSNFRRAATGPPNAAWRQIFLKYRGSS